MSHDYFTFDIMKREDGRIYLSVDEWYTRSDKSQGYSCEMFGLSIDELQALYELIGGYLVQHTNLLDQEAV